MTKKNNASKQALISLNLLTQKTLQDKPKFLRTRNKKDALRNMIDRNFEGKADFINMRYITRAFILINFK